MLYHASAAHLEHDAHNVRNLLVHVQLLNNGCCTIINVSSRQNNSSLSPQFAHFIDNVLINTHIILESEWESTNLQYHGRERYPVRGLVVSAV